MVVPVIMHCRADSLPANSEAMVVSNGSFEGEFAIIYTKMNGQFEGQSCEFCLHTYEEAEDRL